MDTEISTSVTQNLYEKRQKLAEWLESTPESKKNTRLGPVPESAVEEHVHVLDAALEEAGDKVLGICTVCGEPVERRLLEMDYTAHVCLSHLSPKEIRSLEYELELSQVVQKALLPQTVPNIPGLEVAAFSRPAQIISGDFFDFLQFANGNYGVVIADVAGKGVSASLIMASVQTALRTLIPISDSPVEVLRQLNRLFSHNIQFTTFVTLFLGSYDPATRTFTYGNAGHNPPLVFHREDGFGEVVCWLSPSGAAVGLVEDPLFRQETVQLSHSDILLFYTDGVTEAFNESYEQFGNDRILEAVRRAADLPAQDLLGELRQEVRQFIGDRPLMDDATIIAIKVGDAFVSQDIG